MPSCSSRQPSNTRWFPLRAGRFWDPKETRAMNKYKGLLALACVWTLSLVGTASTQAQGFGNAPGGLYTGYQAVTSTSVVVTPNPVVVSPPVVVQQPVVVPRPVVVQQP